MKKAIYQSPQMYIYIICDIVRTSTLKEKDSNSNDENVFTW